jgi:hypothetical protein
VIDTDPQFVSPSDAAPTPELQVKAPAFATLELTNPNDDPTRIVNFKREIAQPSGAGDRGRFAKAVVAADLTLDPEAAYAIARALVDPLLGMRMVQGPTFIEEVVETATLRSVQGELFTTELFPLVQPRTAGNALMTPGPKISGVVDDDGQPLATLRMEFSDRAHLEAFMRQTVRETRRVGKHYEESILARRVSRPVVAHAAILAFEDTGDEIDVVVVRDGITRLVSSYAARLSPSSSFEDVADLIVDTLLRPKAARAGAASSVTQDYARGREAGRTALRSTFEAGLAGKAVSEDSIRIGQTFTIPGFVYVDLEPAAESPLPAAAQFDEAIRAVVSSIHVEFRGWDDASERVEVGDRALHRVGHSGELDQGVMRLAVGEKGPNDMAKIFGKPKIPATALWRGVYIVAWMCHPTSFKAMKRELRAITGLRRIEDKAYIAHLAPLVDRPWRLTKGGSLSQARSAWGNGGPIPKGALNSDWTPQPVADFTDLIPLAIGGDRDARLTLQVAGGIAMVADKILTSNKGSKVGLVVPFRSDVDDVISNLGESEAGLWTLARAANAFDANKIAVNSFTDTELKDPARAAVRARAYRVPRVDPDDSAKLAVDNAGVPQLLTEYAVVSIASPERAAAAESESKQQRKSSAEKKKETEAQTAQRLRRAVRTGFTALYDDVTALIDLAPGTDGSVGIAFEDEEHWNSLLQLSLQIQTALMGAKPGAASDDDDDDDDDDDEDDDEDEL